MVLAIAGLIFLVVFIAWPALQNSQKDTAARQDVNKVVVAIENYYTNNQGGTITFNCWGACPLLGFNNPSTTFAQATQGIWTYVYPDSSSAMRPGGHQSIDIHVGKQCGSGRNSDGSVPLVNADPSSVAVGIGLSSNNVYCANAVR